MDIELKTGDVYYWNRRWKVIVIDVLSYQRARVKPVNKPEYPWFVALKEDLSTKWRK